VTATVADRLAAELLDLIAEEDPLNDALEGYAGFEDRLADVDDASRDRLRSRAAAIAGAATRVDVAGEDRVTLAVVAQQASALVDRLDARLIDHTVADYDTAPVGRLLAALPLVRPRDAAGERALLERLAAVPRYLQQAANRHRDGVRAGRLPVAARTQHAVERVDAYLADPARDPLGDAPLGAAAARERDRLLADVVRPAFAAYRDVLATELVPAGRPQERVGLCWLPGGGEAYASVVRVHTTTDHTPEELHRVGIDLAARLDDEYAEIGARAFGVASPAAVRERLRSDPALRWGSGEELMAAVSAAVALADEAAGNWFGRRPSRPCAVEEAPDPASPGAYYVPPALDGSRPGTFVVNTSRATERHRHLAEATAFHEGIPGHHLQLGLAQELDDLPPLRRYAWINAYIEGWGLYAERLAGEMGLYGGDVARLGAVALDSLRAARLVVDTGLHAFGWSRERAVAYLRATTAMAEVGIEGETDRYIDTPGQALSYMVGRLELERLRRQAEHELGARFDVRAFHDVVLGGGALPMAVLATVVAAWIDAQCTTVPAAMNAVDAGGGGRGARRQEEVVR
jgi:uncharacterized protein (DUF885 family)